MNRRFFILSLSFLAYPAQADVNDASLMRDSIQASKQSIARETLDAFYHDALDYYHEGRNAEALQLLDKIYSIDPHYEDVGKLRETIRHQEQAVQHEATLVTVRDWMKKGEKAETVGQRALAISYWKQALAIDPTYAPAQKKIDDSNKILAKKEFETGYIHYHHGEMEDAMDSWSNAVALDPTYKQRGLLLLMSKVELQARRSQISRLAAQGFDQYSQGHLEDALASYQELTTLEPRNEESRRMAAKIKIQMGQTALKAAQSALDSRAWPEAIDQADKALQYGYEISRSSAIKVEAEHAMHIASLPRPKTPKKPPVAAAATPPPTQAAVAAPPPSSQPANPEEALAHYRQGIAAIRKKDFHLAMDELDAASKLDPSNERIYMARERARQEWNAANSGRTTP